MLASAARLSQLWDGCPLVVSYWDDGCAYFSSSPQLVGRCSSLTFTRGRAPRVLQWRGAPFGSEKSGVGQCPRISLTFPCEGITLEGIVEYLFSGSGMKGRRELEIGTLVFSEEEAGNYSTRRFKELIKEVGLESESVRLTTITVRL